MLFSYRTHQIYTHFPHVKICSDSVHLNPEEISKSKLHSVLKTDTADIGFLDGSVIKNPPAIQET